MLTSKTPSTNNARIDILSISDSMEAVWQLALRNDDERSWHRALHCCQGAHYLLVSSLHSFGMVELSGYFECLEQVARFRKNSFRK